MEKFSLAAIVPIIGLIPAVLAPILATANSNNFLFDLSSDYWADFSASAGIGVVLVVWSVHLSRQRRS